MSVDVATKRGIFRYSNGERLVFGDVQRIQRTLYAALGDPDAVLKSVSSGDLEALETLLSAARVSFNMPALDVETGEGVGEESVRLALESLWEALKPDVAKQ